MPEAKNSPAPRRQGRVKAAASVPIEQLNLPVSFDPDGNMVTLKEAMRPSHGSVLSFAALSPDRRAELTIKRIEAQPEFEVAMVGGGIVDKQRAIREINARSGIGRTLIEIEQRVIQHLLDEVAGRG